MTAAPNWPALLGEYEAALAAFENVSHALTAALTDRNPADFDFNVLVESEQHARETVMLSRLRVIEQWRISTPSLDTAAKGTGHEA